MTVRTSIKVKGLDEYLEALERGSGRNLQRRVMQPVLEEFGDDVKARARDHYLSGKSLDIFTDALRASVDVSRRRLPEAIVIGADDTAGVVWEVGKKPRPWLLPSVEDNLANARRAFEQRWEREVFRG